jgi:hypothetical protein
VVQVIFGLTLKGRNVKCKGKTPNTSDTLQRSCVDMPLYSLTMLTFGGSSSQGHVSAALISGRNTWYLFDKKLAWPQFHSVRLWRRENLLLQRSSIVDVINRIMYLSVNKGSKSLNFVIRRDYLNNLIWILRNVRRVTTNTIQHTCRSKHSRVTNNNPKFLVKRLTPSSQ